MNCRGQWEQNWFSWGGRGVGGSAVQACEAPEAPTAPGCAVGEAAISPAVSLLLIKNNFKERLVLIPKNKSGLLGLPTPSGALGAFTGPAGPVEIALLSVSIWAPDGRLNRFFVVLKLGAPDSPGFVSKLLFPLEVSQIF